MGYDWCTGAVRSLIVVTCAMCCNTCKKYKLVLNYDLSHSSLLVELPSCHILPCLIGADETTTSGTKHSRQNLYDRDTRCEGACLGSYQ